VEQDFVKKLMDKIRRLETENFGLRNVTGDRSNTLALQAIAPTWKILYRLDDGRVSLSEPWATFDVSKKNTISLHIENPLANPARWLEKQEDLAFVVYKDYTTMVAYKPETGEAVASDIMPVPIPGKESVKLISERMIEAFEAFMKVQTGLLAHFSDLDPKSEILAPYRFWYHCRSTDPFAPLESEHKELLGILTKWIEDNYGEIYRHSDENLSQGLVSEDLLDYLVRPGDILITKNEHRFVGYMASSWTKPGPKLASATDRGDEQRRTFSRTVECWQWAYDGAFYRKSSSLQIKLELSESAKEVEVHKLSVFPLRYAKASVQAKLKAELVKRGQTQWSCRGQKLIEYLDESHDHSGIVSTISFQDTLVPYPRYQTCAREKYSQCFKYLDQIL
jgi:hypothetical protein